MQLFSHKMILGVGIDLVSIKRIEKLIDKFESSFEKKLFSVNEISIANNIKDQSHKISKKTLFYAKRFAAKEAFAKAIGLGIGRGIDFKDIEIVNDKLGKPEINILNNKEQFLKEHFNCKEMAINLSISDEESLATAIVIIEKIS